MKASHNPAIKVNISRWEINDELAQLPHKEFETLVALARAKGQVLSRAEIMAEVYQGSVPNIDVRTIDNYVCRLRRKFGADSIITVGKRGYKVSKTVEVVG